MWDIFEKIRRINVLLVGGLTIVGFGIFITINLLIFGNLPESDYGIIAYEFAWTVDKVLEIFSDWGVIGMSAQATGIWSDFPYILGYSLFISGCIWLTARMNKEKMQNFGLIITFAPFLAGFLDAIENTFLLIMLNNPSSIRVLFPQIAAICAGLKFALIIAGILYFLVALVLGIINKLRK
jgi:hypothetical protein